MNKPRSKNRAKLSVTFPDGCRASWELLPRAPEAMNALKFAAWLHEVADIIHEGSTNEGQHVEAEGGHDR